MLYNTNYQQCLQNATSYKHLEILLKSFESKTAIKYFDCFQNIIGQKMAGNNDFRNIALGFTKLFQFKF